MLNTGPDHQLTNPLTTAALPAAPLSSSACASIKLRLSGEDTLPVSSDKNVQGILGKVGRDLPQVFTVAELLSAIHTVSRDQVLLESLRGTSPERRVQYDQFLKEVPTPRSRDQFIELYGEEGGANFAAFANFESFRDHQKTEISWKMTEALRFALPQEVFSQLLELNEPHNPLLGELMQRAMQLRREIKQYVKEQGIAVSEENDFSGPRLLFSHIRTREDAPLVLQMKRSFDLLDIEVITPIGMMRCARIEISKLATPEQGEASLINLFSLFKFLPFEVKDPTDNESLKAMLGYDTPGLLLVPAGKQIDSLFPAYPLSDTSDVSRRREREVLKYKPTEAFSSCPDPDPRWVGKMQVDAQIIQSRDLDNVPSALTPDLAEARKLFVAHRDNPERLIPLLFPKGKSSPYPAQVALLACGQKGIEALAQHDKVAFIDERIPEIFRTDVPRDAVIFEGATPLVDRSEVKSLMPCVAPESIRWMVDKLIERQTSDLALDERHIISLLFAAGEAAAPALKVKLKTATTDVERGILLYILARTDPNPEPTLPTYVKALRELIAWKPDDLEVQSLRDEGIEACLSCIARVPGEFSSKIADLTTQAYCDTRIPSGLSSFDSAILNIMGRTNPKSNQAFQRLKNFCLQEKFLASEIQDMERRFAAPATLSA